MANKWAGFIGFGESVETKPGVWQDTIVEKKHYGDVKRNSRRLEDGEKVNNDLTVGNSISVVADAYLNEHFYAIRYITWQGARWTISNVDVEPPRLILRLGALYNGQSSGA